ncbi:MAG TPA: Lrp/AsnC family transcriptional regulator [Candidatus Nanoarchaeia archaeon]|nr:Lrp/AsnC family transcriptional regulator [Candidatus Nanoarchaeia archaeon]
MLDEKDKIILDILQEDASLSTYKIAKKTRIPQTTVLNRMRKLKKEGIIRKYTIDIDWKKQGMNNKALIFVKVDKNTEQKKGKVGEIEEKISKYPLVLNVKRLMGKYDFMIELVCRDIDELNGFLIKKIRSLPEIADTETVMILSEWKK